MKKNLIVSLLFILAAMVNSFGQITGSGHDFSGNAWANNEICIVCHTPHNGTSTGNAPLWNRQLSSVASYTLYSSTTLDAGAAIDPVANSVSNSRLCLSCHDGTVALENFGGFSSGTTTIALYGAGVGNLGIDLSNDHPISFIYDAALSIADQGLHDPTTTPVLNGTISTQMLFGGRLECASCHDVYDNSYGYFLRMDNTNSALCLTCHNK